MTQQIPGQTCVMGSGELGRRLGSAMASARVAPGAAAEVAPRPSTPLTHSTWKSWM